MLRFIEWIFALLAGRAIVRQRSLLRGVDMVRIHLEDRGYAKFKDLPEQVLTPVVQEAYRRAAEGELDKRARYGPYYSQLRLLSVELASALQRGSSTDSRINSILKFNHLI